MLRSAKPSGGIIRLTSQFTTAAQQVMSVVIVNTLLTSVMSKLAKFERHVSLSDYTSTVTAKLALAQFLNTALIVIIVNAGYTGGGLGLLQVSEMASSALSVSRFIALSNVVRGRSGRAPEYISK